MIAQRRSGRHEISRVRVGKGLRQLIEVTAEQLDVQGVSSVSDEGGSGGLLFHVATEVRSPHPSAQDLLSLAEEVLGHVVGTADDGEDDPVGRRHRGVRRNRGNQVPCDSRFRPRLPWAPTLPTRELPNLRRTGISRNPSAPVVRGPFAFPGCSPAGG